MPYPTTAIPHRHPTPPVLCGGGSIAQCCACFRCPHPSLSDTLWNGVAASVKMAELCDTFEVNCAAHNYHGWLGTAISAHFCAAIPNFKVLEVDVDDVPWKDTITTGTVRFSIPILFLIPNWFCTQRSLGKVHSLSPLSPLSLSSLSLSW